MQLDVASVDPGDALRRRAAWGRRSAMLEWMFKVTSMPWDRAHFRKAPGRGTDSVFHSHPSQSLGAFQSVSSDSVLSGHWFFWKAG